MQSSKKTFNPNATSNHSPIRSPTATAHAWNVTRSRRGKTKAQNFTADVAKVGNERHIDREGYMYVNTYVCFSVCVYVNTYSNCQQLADAVRQKYFDCGTWCSSSGVWQWSYEGLTMYEEKKPSRFRFLQATEPVPLQNAEVSSSSVCVCECFSCCCCCWRCSARILPYPLAWCEQWRMLCTCLFPIGFRQAKQQQQP